MMHPMWLEHGKQGRVSYIRGQRLRNRPPASHTVLDALFISFKAQKSTRGSVLLFHFTNGDWGLELKYLACGCSASKRESLDVNTGCPQSQHAQLLPSTACWLHAPVTPVSQSIAVPWLWVCSCFLTGWFNNRILGLWFWLGSLLLK